MKITLLVIFNSDFSVIDQQLLKCYALLQYWKMEAESDSIVAIYRLQETL
jgi:hypothetical protein